MTGDWSWDDLADALAAGLQRAEAELALEQAVHGLDALGELELHPILHAALRERGYGVTPEVRFPRDRVRRRRTEGVRCDMVVTPSGLPLADPAAQLGLFDPRGAVPLADAAWIEVKVVAQHGEGGPNAAYAYALQQPVWKDITKLAADPDIRHAAALVVLFAADPEVAAHDLAVCSLRARLRGLALGPRAERTLPIADRLGNRTCAVALFTLAR